jgi:hypothetical protein
MLIRRFVLCSSWNGCQPGAASVCMHHSRRTTRAILMKHTSCHSAWCRQRVKCKRYIKVLSNVPCSVSPCVSLRLQRPLQHAPGGHIKCYMQRELVSSGLSGKVYRCAPYLSCVAFVSDVAHAGLITVYDLQGMQKRSGSKSAVAYLARCARAHHLCYMWVQSPSETVVL